MKNWLLKVLVVTTCIFLVCIGGYLILDASISSYQIVATAESSSSVSTTKSEFAERYKNYLKNEYEDEGNGSPDKLDIGNMFTQEDTGWSESQVLRANVIYSVMEPMGMDDQLICGFIGNSLHEGAVGMVEGNWGHAYWSAAGPSAKALAGKTLSSMQDVDVLLNDINPQDARGIGVGMIQWSGGRRTAVLNLYKSMDCDFTPESMQLVETTMLSNEIKPGSSYHKNVIQFYESRKGTCKDNAERVKLATGVVLGKYEMPGGWENHVDTNTFIAHDDFERTKSALKAWEVLSK